MSETAQLRQEIFKAQARLQLSDVEHSDGHKRTYGDCYCLPAEMRTQWLEAIGKLEDQLAEAEAREREWIKQECAMGKFLRMTEQ